MNGPANMYRLKPVFQIPPDISLPSCMYKMKNPVACVTAKNTTQNVESSNNNMTVVVDKASSPDIALLEARWDSIMEQLNGLKLQMGTIRKTVTEACKVLGCPLIETSVLNNLKMLQGAVINANPSHPPYALLFVKHLYASSVPISLSTHVHSDLSSVPDSVKCFEDSLQSDENNKLKLHLIWKEGITDTELVINPVKHLPIRGEVNILRLLARSGLQLLGYPAGSMLETVEIDSILDISHRLLHVTTSKEKASLYKKLNAKLGKSAYYGGDNINISDISLWSALKQINVNVSQDLGPNLAKWFVKMDKVVF